MKNISRATLKGRAIPVTVLLILTILLSVGSGLYAGASFFAQQAPNVTITTTIFTTTTSWTTSTIWSTVTETVQGVLTTIEYTTSTSTVTMTAGTVTSHSRLPVTTGLLADKSSPQSIGATITFTATATDPDGDTVLYRFWMRKGSGSWTMVQDWSSSNAYAWTPTQTGGYQFIVWIRDGYHAGPALQDDWSFWTVSGVKSQRSGSSLTIQ
ncbi:MAG: hypothetical protein WCC94_09150 [Candidatus Bathyarchaeia archaeon]